jgi:hypothetical protein
MQIYKADDIIEAFATGDWPPPGHTDPEIWVRLGIVPASSFEQVLARHHLQITGVTVHQFADAIDIVYCVRVAPLMDGEG